MHKYNLNKRQFLFQKIQSSMFDETLGNGLCRVWCQNTEELGIMIEKMICDISNIPFNTKRNYTDVPLSIKSDIENNIRKFLDRVRIAHHVGNENKAIDFFTTKNHTVSIKTIMSGDKICPQNIGQCSIKSFCERYKIRDNPFCCKKYSCQQTHSLISEYLQHLFTCDHLVVFNFAKSQIVCLRKLGTPKFCYTLDIYTKKGFISWQLSNTNSVFVKTSNGKSFKLGEIQLHSNGKRMKFRFSFNNLLKLIQAQLVQGIAADVYALKGKYKISLYRDPICK